MKVLLAGGTGFLGSHVARALVHAGHHVAVLTRNPGAARRAPGVEAELWDGRTPGRWVESLATAGAVVNLAGESLNARRWSVRQKANIVESRVHATRAVVDAMAPLSGPRILINASGVGYYGPIADGEVREDHAQGMGFLAETCGLWEREAIRAERPGTRVVRLRMGVVLGEHGGALEKLLIPFRLFLGGPIGSGRQWFPWIHREDVAEIILFVLERTSITGALNLAAPEPVTMETFCRTLGKVLHRPSWFRVPAGLLKVALGERAEIVLEGQNAVPFRLLENGYAFRYPRLEDALRSVLGGAKET
jgi:hypothetical protein